VVAVAVVAAAGRNLYTLLMRKLFFLLLVWLMTLSSAWAQVGESTKQVLDNVASQQKPQAVVLEEESCKILGIFNCPAPKVDYTHADLLPQNQQISEEGVTFWQKIGSFLTGLFEKSSDKQTGYGYTYLPQAVDPLDETDDSLGINLQTETEKTHLAVKNSQLPYAFNGQLTPIPTLEPGSVTPTSGVENPDEDIPPVQGDNTVEYARSLVQTAGKSCGWTKANERTRTLGCNNCTLPESKDAEPIRCLDGKVKNDVYLDLSASANGNSWLQCVGFVIGVEQGMGRMLASRNAKDYCSGNPPPNYSYVDKGQIRPGDIVANTEPPWGHIMIILEFYKGSQAYRVAEANWTVSGSMSVSMDRLIYSSDIDCVLRSKSKFNEN